VPTLTEDEAALLDDNSDDWYGLWEVDWWFNGVHPDWPHTQRAEMVGSLVQRELMEVFFGRLGLESQPMSAEAALDALAKPQHWAPRTSPEQAVYHVSTSSKGNRALGTGRAECRQRECPLSTLSGPSKFHRPVQ
jgi:hypothetical protein